MKKNIYLSLILASVLFSLGEQNVFGEMMPLGTFIGNAERKCGVVFTLEAAYLEEARSGTQLGEKVSFQEFPANIDSVIQTLTNSLTNLTVMVDTTNAKIYHIIDKRLLAMDGYSMGQVLTSVKFDGNGEDFVNYIKETVPNLTNNRFFSGAVIILNSGTIISIDSKNISVRQALTSGLDLSSDKPVQGLIWKSVTSLKTRQTSVAF